MAGMDEMFENFNQYGGIDFLSASSADGLRDQIAQFRGRIYIMSIYYDANEKKHVAWVTSDRKIKKVNQNQKRGN